MFNASKPIEIQSNFIFNIPGKNLEEDNIVFTVKKNIHLFLDKFGFLLEDEKHERGRPRIYETEDLLGLIVLGTSNNKNSCRELKNGQKTMRKHVTTY